MGASRQTFAERQSLQIGGAMAAALPQRMSQAEVARQLGMTQQNVSYIERKALAKLRARLIELRNEAVANNLA